MIDLELMRPMTDTQRLLFQTEMLKHRKSVGVAALLCVLGPVGVHRFYLGEIGRGVVMLALTLTGIGLIITVPWAVLDLLNIGRVVGAVNEAKAREVAAQIMAFQAVDGTASTTSAPPATTPVSKTNVPRLIVLILIGLVLAWVGGVFR